ncbi:hypothetical protein B0H13DRAFT_2544517 [Mycena leptocephala]|nr:hypothetical protein B0H13DRAFT_2544517 [Mycena leptocephala]
MAHTLCVQLSVLLLFGGMPSPSVALSTQPDSACLLDVYNRLVPRFINELSGWANEPVRRMYHAAVSAITGEVYIFGGQMADGSIAALSDHYVFDPNAVTFALLPTDNNAPPALTGHAAVFCRMTVSSTDVPPSRRGFAYVLLDDNTILIHGGCSGDFQETYSDGWIYNITTTTWTNVPILEQLGQRKDHFAASYGGQVIFGFGYAANAPANATLSIYDPTSQTFQPSFTAAAPTSTVSPTIPVASATDTGVGGPTLFPARLLARSHPRRPAAVAITAAAGAGITAAAVTAIRNSKHHRQNDGDRSRDCARVLALVGMGVGGFWYMHKQQQHRWAEGGVGGVFSPLNDEEGGPGGGPSAAQMFDAPPAEKSLLGGAVETVGTDFDLAGVLGTGVAARERDAKQRRDMLADEDAQEFGWYDETDGHSSRLGRLRQGSGGSTWSLMSVFRPKPKREGSAASGMTFPSRAGSLLGHGQGPSEKDPFRDDMYLRDAAAAGGAGLLAASATRPKGHRQASYASVNSVGSNYIDPFADPISEQDLAGPGALLLNTLNHGYSRAGPLSPVTEISRLSSSGGSASHSGSSHDHPALSPFSTMSRSSFGFTSNSHQGSPALPVGASPAASPDQPIRRSDTWWARFANKSLLDRKSSRGSTSNVNVAVPDFRDPTPLPQRLGFVKEETSSVLRERSDGSDTSARAGPVYGRGATHGKSMSSIQTADSAAIERMGGNIDVMLRENRQTGSTSTRGSVTTHGGSVDEGHAQRRSWQPSDNGEEGLYTSPVEMVPASAFGLPTSPPRELSPPPTPTASRPALSTSSSGSSGGVSDRIKAYERRMSQDVTPPPPPTNTKQREERTPRKNTHGVNYGLVARPSLFVANPDHGAGEGSGDA